MSHIAGVAIFSGLLLLLAPGASRADSFAVNIQVDASKANGVLAPIWRFFGADEPNYATMHNGQQLLAELGALAPHQVYFRAHNLLTSGDGSASLKWGSTNAYTEDANGNPIYNWTMVDAIFDSYLRRGVKPYVEVGFMPEALSIKPKPYRHAWRQNQQSLSGGWQYPPQDYDKWADLIYHWVLHSVERYGRAEVETWYWEVWNEPNIVYWQGTPEEFYKLHDYAMEAIRRALPTARVGGPHVAGSGGAFMDGFLEHITSGKNYATGARGTATDFLAFHAKGQPTTVDGHVRMGIAAQLSTIDVGFNNIAARPELKALPVIIGESDPDGCAACQAPQLGYRTGTMYSSYTAAVLAREHELATRHSINLEGTVTWAFEFEDQPYFAGFRQLASNGIDLPVMNVFRLFSLMPAQRVAASSDAQIKLDEIIKNGVREHADVGVLASEDKSRLAILVWHYHDDDISGADANVTLQISNLPALFARGGLRLTHYRIDKTHSNAYSAWQRMGSPSAPSETQLKQLHAASKVATLASSRPVSVRHDAATINFTLPRQGVSLLVLSAAP